MSSRPNSPCTLVARFLRSNNYTETLAAFIAEAGLPADAGLASSGKDGGEWTIEKIVEEKYAFDKSLSFDRRGQEEGEAESGWSVPAPSQPNALQTSTASNLLSVSVQRANIGNGEQPTCACSIIATGADKRISFLDVRPEHSVSASYSSLVDSPILSCISLLDGAYVAMTTMSGKLVFFQESEIVYERKDHGKYAVQVVSCVEEEKGRVWLATAGWDKRILIYSINLTDETLQLPIGEPVAVIDLLTNPECILFIRNQDTQDLILLASRQDSAHLYYYLIDSHVSPTPNESSKPNECRLLGKQNLAPQSNSWVSFSPSSFSLSPNNPNLLAVATSSTPHMKLIIVRLLVPSSVPPEHDPVDPATQAAQALAELALQSREEAAISLQVNTMAPQTAYSTPQVAWRPDGSGVWVNGDDGAVRGIEVKTGKLALCLRGGHEPNAKVRCLWTGRVQVPGTDEMEEWVLSGGFDKKLIVWKVSEEGQRGGDRS